MHINGKNTQKFEFILKKRYNTEVEKAEVIIMNKMEIAITNDFITLGQLLKTADIISSGGMAKAYLQEFYVYVNDEEEQRRGKKLYPGDIIELPAEELEIVIVSQD